MPERSCTWTLHPNPRGGVIDSLCASGDGSFTRLRALLARAPLSDAARTRVVGWPLAWRVVGVWEAEQAGSGKGHDYFRNSPWVSSDVLLTLGYNLSPQQRGLALDKKTNMWYFSKDYPKRVVAELRKIDPKILNAKTGK